MTTTTERATKQSPGVWLLDLISQDRPVTDVERGRAERAIRDLTSVIVRGDFTESVQAAAAYAAGANRSGEAMCWATAKRVDPETAAFVNGTSGQALDYDDIHPKSVSHLSAVLVSAVGALASQMTVSPVDAVARGMYIADRLGTLMNLEAYRRGFQPTHTVATYAAVAALSHGLQLPRSQREGALGLVATHAIGLRAHTGVSYKAMQSGIASSAAVRSVLLARLGIVGGLSAVDVMFNLIGIGDQVPDEDSGEPSFLAIKQFPTCGGVHAALEAVLALRERTPDREGIRLSVSAPPRHFMAMHFYPPQNVDEARFSYRYCMALGWVHGEVLPEHFLPDALKDPAVVKVMDEIETIPDESVHRDGDDVTVTLHRGDTVVDSYRVPERNGYPTRPIPEEFAREKFISCMGYRLGREKATALYQQMAGPKIFEIVEQALAAAGEA